MDGNGRGRKHLEEMQGSTRGGEGEQKRLPRNGAQGWQEREEEEEERGERKERESVRQSETDTWMDPIGPAFLVFRY